MPLWVEHYYIWRMDRLTSAKTDVYYRVRVFKSAKQTSATGTRTLYEYNGLTGNDWLGAIGIENEPSKKQVKRQKPSVPKLNSSLEYEIRERAKSANAILGRRHFDKDNTALGEDNVITCKSILPKPRHIEITDKEIHDARDNAAVLDNTNTTRNRSMSIALSELPNVDPMIQCKEFVHNDKFHNRPQTEIGKHYAQRPSETRLQNRIEHVEEEFPNLHIRQLIACKHKAKHEKELPDENNKVNSKMHAPTIRFVKQETICFNTIKDMKKAFSDRVKSAPAIPQKEATGDKDGASNKDIWESKDPYLAFLKSKKTQVSKPKDKPVLRGPFLKPLMYNEDLDIGCDNHGCSDCFKACLASDEFVEKVNDDHKQGKLVKSPRKLKFKPKLLVRRINKSYEESSKVHPWK